MFDKNRVHFMNAYYKETEKPFGYLLVDNKPDTPADKQVLAWGPVWRLPRLSLRHPN
jgi:hypothetical protein